MSLSVISFVETIFFKILISCLKTKTTAPPCIISKGHNSGSVDRQVILRIKNLAGQASCSVF